MHSFSLYLPEVWGKPDKDGKVARVGREADARGRGSGLIPDKSEVGHAEGNGLLVGKEPFDINDKDAIEALFKKFSEETIDSLIEKAIVISPDGFRYDVEGTDKFVNPQVVRDESLKGAIIIHNHPGPDGDSFSIFDFKGFFESGSVMEEVVYNIAGQRMRHRMEWVGERLTPDNAEAIWDSALDALNQEAWDAQRSGGDPQSVWSGGEQHSVMRYLKRTLKGLRFYEL